MMQYFSGAMVQGKEGNFSCPWLQGPYPTYAMIKNWKTYALQQIKKYVKYPEMPVRPGQLCQVHLTRGLLPLASCLTTH